MIHFPNLFPLQNINKQAVHMNIIMWKTSLQAKWENNHIIIFISQLFGLYFVNAVNTDILLRDFSPSTLFRAPDDSGHTAHR